MFTSKYFNNRSGKKHQRNNKFKTIIKIKYDDIP